MTDLERMEEQVAIANGWLTLYLDYMSEVKERLESERGTVPINKK